MHAQNLFRATRHCVATTLLNLVFRSLQIQCSLEPDDENDDENDDEADEVGDVKMATLQTCLVGTIHFPRS